MLTVSPNHRVVRVEDDIVVLDILRDRYSALPLRPGADATLGMVELREDLSLPMDAADALEGMAILQRGTGAVGSPLLPPSHTIVRRGTASATLWDATQLAGALVVAGARLARRRHFRIVDAVGSGIPGEQETESLADALDRLDTLRTLIPTPRRCLPAALTAALFLRSRGHSCHLVFGVRCRPFEPHCWLQREDAVLDDDLDRVRTYRPIAVAIL